MKIQALAAIGLILVLSHGVGRAQTAPTPDDVLSTVGGINTVCAGSTTDSRQRWVQQPFSMRLEFVGKNGQYLGQEQVSIAGRDLNLQVICNGPWVLMNLPAGAYHVSADVRDASKKDFDLTVGPGSPRVTIVRFTDSGGEICIPQPNDDCKSDQSGVTAGLNAKGLAPESSDPELARLNAAARQVAGALVAQQQQYNSNVAAYNGMLNQDRVAATQLAAAKTQCAGDLQGMYDALQTELRDQKRWNKDQRKKYQDETGAYAAKQQSCAQQIAMLDANQKQTSAQVAQISNLLTDNGRQIASLNQQLTEANLAVAKYRDDPKRGAR